MLIFSVLYLVFQLSQCVCVQSLPITARTHNRTMDPKLKFEGPILAGACSAMRPTGCCFRTFALGLAALAQQLCLPQLAAEYLSLPGRCEVLQSSSGGASCPASVFSCCFLSRFARQCQRAHGTQLCSLSTVWSRLAMHAPTCVAASVMLQRKLAVPDSCIPRWDWLLLPILKPRADCGAWSGETGGQGLWTGQTCSQEQLNADTCPNNVCGLWCGVVSRFQVTQGGWRI
jgi:hypothetical protein